MGKNLYEKENEHEVENEESGRPKSEFMMKIVHCTSLFIYICIKVYMYLIHC